MMNKCVIINLLQVWLKVLVKFLGVCCLLFFNLYGMDDSYLNQVYGEYTIVKEGYKATVPEFQSFSQLGDSLFLEFEDRANQNNYDKQVLLGAIAKLWLYVEKSLRNDLPNMKNDDLNNLIKTNELFYLKMLFFKDKHNAIAWYDDNRISLKHKKKYLTSVFSYDIAEMMNAEDNCNILMRYLKNETRFHDKAYNSLSSTQCEIVNEYQIIFEAFSSICFVGLACAGCYECGIKAPIIAHLLTLSVSGLIACGIYISMRAISGWYVYLHYKDRLFPNRSYVDKVVHDTNLHLKYGADYCTLLNLKSDKNKNRHTDNDSLDAIDQLLSDKEVDFNTKLGTISINYHITINDSIRPDLYVRSIDELRTWLKNNQSTIYFNPDSYFSCLVACILDGKKNNITMENNKLLSFVESLGRYQKALYPQLKNTKQSSFIWCTICDFLQNKRIPSGTGYVSCNGDLQRLKKALRDRIKNEYTIKEEKELSLALWHTSGFLGNLFFLFYFYDQDIIFHSKLALCLWLSTKAFILASFWFYKSLAFALSPYPPDSFYE